MKGWFSLSVFLMILWIPCRASELTFELPDRDRQCFYQEIEAGTQCSLEYQVISGGNNDVDVVLYDPDNMILYEDKRKQFYTHDFTTKKKGDYQFCFSNEFSSFTHKLVYFDLQVGSDDQPLTPDLGSHHTALTQLEMATVRIHESLKMVKDYQTHHRLKEMAGRDGAEFLNERVQYWSLGESIIFMTIGLTTVFILRRFFASKRNRI